MTEQTLTIREHCLTVYSIQGEHCITWLINQEAGVKAQWLRTEVSNCSLYRALPQEEFNAAIQYHDEILKTLQEVDINTHDSLFFTYDTEEVNYNPHDLNQNQPEIQPSGFIPVYE